MKKISKGRTGVAGEYYVAAELSKQGFVASITLRNTKGVDILVSNDDGSKSRAIQVKTSLGSEKSWILNKNAEENSNENLFYVFVNLRKKEERPDFYIVASKIVADFIKTTHQVWLSNPGKGGRKRNDSDMRKFSVLNNVYLEKWESLGLD